MNTDRETLFPGELALARATFYRLCAQAFRYPGPGWQAEWHEIARGIGAAFEVLALAERTAGDSQAAARTRAELHDAFDLAFAASGDLDALQRAHARLVGHSPRAGVTPYETEWTGSAGELLQYHLLADLGGFYRAFGLELAAGCDERADHLSVELCFLSFLCLKEAHGEERGLIELVESVRSARQQFLSEHLLRWTEAFASRVRREDPQGFHGRAARLLELFLRLEGASLAVVSVPGALTELRESSLELGDCCMGCELAVKCGSANPPGPSGSSGEQK